VATRRARPQGRPVEGARNVQGRSRIVAAEVGMSPDGQEPDLSQYYAQRNVEAIILLKVDTQRADDIANALNKFPEIHHSYLVTGEDDIVIKASFQSYKDLKNFIIKTLAPLEGIVDTKTMMVVTTYKENGKMID
jgi:DNA-binding Lrp family transcriptional regulator